MYLVAAKLMPRQIMTGGGTSKIEPDLVGQEKQDKGHEEDNEMEKIKMPLKSLLFSLC